MVSDCGRRGRPRPPPPGPTLAPAAPLATSLPPPAPQLVERRNARERRRVQAVNCAFSRLRRLVASTAGSGRRVSKVKTLRRAIDYIRQLQLQLQLHAAGECLHPQRPDVDDDVSTSPWTHIPDCCELQTSDKENSTSGHQFPSPQQCQYTVPRQENSDTDKVCATGNYMQGLDCDLDGLLRGCYHHQLL
ncbi:helix-loop-helix protein 3-like [Schistocerca gregaria]|uniref:helix-loop-helix protein 3-like n=1 Tax=Schistocerca gregaria TaxID=7010 RepID=UPI00211E9497|nr:helix-loop-helix protein 3-like [Schistocerca gregaria]